MTKLLIEAPFGLVSKVTLFIPIVCKWFLVFYYYENENVCIFCFITYYSLLCGVID